MSVKSAGNVILLADATYEAAEGTDAPPLPDIRIRAGRARRSSSARSIFPPFPALADAAAGFGHNLFVLDPDGPLRHTVPFVRTGDRVLPSLGAGGGVRAAGIRPEQVRLEGDVLDGRRSARCR